MIDPYVKMMFGENARHVAFNLILQRIDNKKAALIGTTSFGDIMGYGYKKDHCLLSCDAVIRPHIVIESDHLAGTGAAGILTSSSMAGIDDWLEHGNFIIKPPNPNK